MKTLTTKITDKDQIQEAFKSATSRDGGEKGVLWAQRYALIARQPFFRGLSPRQLEMLTDDALEVQFEAGQQIFREGSQANRFFLILDGRVMLESDLGDRGMVPIQALGPGDDLGWSWLLPPYTLQFSACAIEPTKAIFFYGTRLREQCEQDHDLGYELMKRISEVIMKRLQATRRQLLGSAG